MIRYFVIAAIALAALTGLGAHTARAGTTAPTCYDYVSGTYYQATQWLEAPGTLIGTDGPDVLVGTGGADVIKGLGGDDIICSTSDVAGLQADPNLTADRVYGGAGNDRVFGLGLLDGGSGDDILIAFFRTSKALGGKGNDQIYPVSGASADAGGGDDQIQASDPAGTLLGGPGRDLVFAEEGAVKIDCGSGLDYFYAPEGTRVRRCERVGA